MALVSHLAPAALLLTTFAPFALSAEFANPQSIKSLDGVLSTSIDLDWVEIKNIGSIFPKPFVTRAVGGSVPGPTLRVSPGDTLEVEFCNKLTKQEGSRQDTPKELESPTRLIFIFTGGTSHLCYQQTTPPSTCFPGLVIPTPLTFRKITLVVLIGSILTTTDPPLFILLAVQPWHSLLKIPMTHPISLK